MCNASISHEPARAGDRHTMPARSPSVGGNSSRAIWLPGIMLASLRVSPAGCLSPNTSPLLLKLQIYPWIKSPLHFHGTSGLLPLISLFLSHLLTPTTRTLPPCRQYHSTSLNIKTLLVPLTGPDNPILLSLFLLLPKVHLWQWTVYHWKYPKLFL